MPFVSANFHVPEGLASPRFRLEPLGPEHNDRDYAAWTSSMEHIHASPGFENSRWPYDMTSEENLSDLEGHARDFAERTGFTYSVLDGDDVIGCVYIYPDREGSADARVRSWVRVDRADLDLPLRRAVGTWLAEAWPFERVEYDLGGSTPEESNHQ
jgi:hypothetical protein